MCRAGLGFRRRWIHSGLGVVDFGGRRADGFVAENVVDGGVYLEDEGRKQ